MSVRKLSKSTYDVLVVKNATNFSNVSIFTLTGTNMYFYKYPISR